MENNQSSNDSLPIDQTIRSLEIQADITKMLKNGLPVEIVLSILKFRAELLQALHNFVNKISITDEEDALLLAVKYASDAVENSSNDYQPILYTDAELEEKVTHIINTLQNDDFKTYILSNNETFLAQFVSLHDTYKNIIPAQQIFNELMTQILDMFNANGVWRHY